MISIRIDDDDDYDDDEDVTATSRWMRRIKPADTLGSIIPRVAADVDRKRNDRASSVGRVGRFSALCVRGAE